MRKIAIIGGSKSFNDRLIKILKTADIEWKFFTRYMVKKENYYDYIVLNSNSNIKDIFIRGNYCFVNMDLIDSKNSNVNIYGNIITYGLGSKNTVTVSSMGNSSFVYCLQRDLSGNESGILEPEEIPLNMDFSSEEDIYAAMVGITVSLIEGKKIISLTKEKRLAVLK